VIVGHVDEGEPHRREILLFLDLQSRGREHLREQAHHEQQQQVQQDGDPEGVGKLETRLIDAPAQGDRGG